jgi:probable HAF family extracellular repeat protein
VGEVVGGATTAGDVQFHAFVWRHGVMTDLRTFPSDPGDCSSVALAVNSKSQIVGTSCGRAVLWDKGSIIDLNTVIPANSSLILNFPFNINDRGEIVSVADAKPNLPPNSPRVVILIPCHLDDSQGCEDNAEVTTAATHNDPASVTKSPTTSTQRHLTASDMVAEWRSRMERRYHIPGVGSSPRD